MSVATFDALAYALLPSEMRARFLGYGTATERTGALGGRGTAPRDYFQPDSALGFDLRPGAHGRDVVDGVAFPIWANDLGCFDRSAASIAPGYVYFGGDSFTWGYSPFEDKFTTMYERLVGQTTLKCGVTHTGQRHQFGKFRAVVAALGAAPKRVFVGWHANDLLNDRFHPHSTVVDGWLVDDIYVHADDASPVRVDEAFLRATIAAALARTSHDTAHAGVARRAKQTVKHYSLTSHLADAALTHIGRATRGDVHRERNRATYQGRLIEPFHVLERDLTVDGVLQYADTIRSGANQRALLAWADDARRNGYRLTVLVLPERAYYDAPTHLREVIEFLDRNGIEHVDMRAELHAIRARAGDVFWPRDGHYSPNGNRLLAGILARKFPDG